MSAYKKFTAQDYAIVPFNAHKQYSYGSSSAASNQITHYATQWTSESISLYSTSSGPTGGDTINAIKYNQIDHLFYKDFLTNHANLFGDFHYQYHKRNLYEKANIISIPEGLYGEGIKPGSFYLSSSNYVIVDDGYGNLLLNDLDVHNYPTDLRANVFRLDPIKGFRHYDLGLFNDYALKLLDPQHPEEGTYKAFWKKGKINPNAPKTYSTHGDLQEKDDSYFLNPFRYQSVNFNTSSLGDDNHKFPCITFNGVTGSKVIVPHDERFNFDTKDNFAVSFNMQPNTLSYEGVGVPLGVKSKFQGGYIFNVTGDYAYIVKPELQTNLGREYVHNPNLKLNDGFPGGSDGSFALGSPGNNKATINTTTGKITIGPEGTDVYSYAKLKGLDINDYYQVNITVDSITTPSSGNPPMLKINNNSVNYPLIGKEQTSGETTVGKHTITFQALSDNMTLYVTDTATNYDITAVLSKISVRKVLRWSDNGDDSYTTNNIGDGLTTTANMNNGSDYLGHYVNKSKSGYSDWWLPNKAELNSIYSALDPYNNINFIGIVSGSKKVKSLDATQNRLVVSEQFSDTHFNQYNEGVTIPAHCINEPELSQPGVPSGNELDCIDTSINGGAGTWVVESQPNDYQQYTPHLKDSPDVFQYLVIRKVNIKELDSYRRDIIGKSTTKTVIPTSMEGRSEVLNTSISGNMQPMDIPEESQFPFEIYMKSNTLYFDRADTYRKESISYTIPMENLINSSGEITGSSHILCQLSASWMEIYVNGEKKAYKSTSITEPPRNRANLYIGSKGDISKPDSYSTNAQFRYFNGNLSNINIWENSFVEGNQINRISESINASPYIGNIFYTNGFATITHPNYYSVLGSVGIGEMAIESDFAVDSQFHTGISKLEFQGTHKIREWEYQCTVDEHEYNSTMNISARKSLSNNIYELADFTTSSLFKPYVTTIGLYDENNNLLVVGKLNQPVKTSNETDTTFIVRWDT